MTELIKDRPAPGSRNPERTRRNILMAAAQEFAAKGLGGARVNEIAAEAGANKRMLYHYFGDKEGLFTAVIEWVYAGLCEAAERVDVDNVPPIEGIQRLIRFIWTYYRDHPEAITLLNSENLHQARHIANSDIIRSLETPFVATIERLLERGRDAGVMKDDIDAVDLYISIVALCYYYRSNQHTLSTFFNRNIGSDRNQSRWRRHVEDLILSYLRPEQNR